MLNNMIAYAYMTMLKLNRTMFCNKVRCVLFICRFANVEHEQQIHGFFSCRNGSGNKNIIHLYIKQVICETNSNFLCITQAKPHKCWLDFHNMICTLYNVHITFLCRLSYIIFWYMYESKMYCTYIKKEKSLCMDLD